VLLLTPLTAPKIPVDSMLPRSQIDHGSVPDRRHCCAAACGRPAQPHGRASWPWTDSNLPYDDDSLKEAWAFSFRENYSAHTSLRLSSSYRTSDEVAHDVVHGRILGNEPRPLNRGTWQRGQRPAGEYAAATSEGSDRL
jgi:hypothetical protein